MFGIEIEAFSIHLHGHSSTSKEFCFTVHGKKTFACNLIILKYFKDIEIDINFFRCTTRFLLQIRLCTELIIYLQRHIKEIWL